MRATALALSVLFAVPAFGAEPATAPSTSPADRLQAAEQFRRVVGEMNLRLAAAKADNDRLRTENAQLKAQVAKLAPPAPAGNAVSVGMTTADVMGIITRTGEGYRHQTRREALVRGKKVVEEDWYLNRPKGGHVHFTDGIVDIVQDD